MAPDEETTEEVVEETSEETTEETTEKSIEDVQKELDEAKVELEKERAKDKNFKDLRDKHKQTISQRVEGMETQLKTERENRQNLQDSIMSDAKESSLDQLAGTDKDLRQKLIERVKESEAYLGAPKNSKELTERYEKAYGYVEGVRKKVNPLHSYTATTGTEVDRARDKKFTSTPDGKALFEKKFGASIKKAQRINPEFKI